MVASVDGKRKKRIRLPRWLEPANGRNQTRKQLMQSQFYPSIHATASGTAVAPGAGDLGSQLVGVRVQLYLLLSSNTYAVTLFDASEQNHQLFASELNEKWFH